MFVSLSSRNMPLNVRRDEVSRANADVTRRGNTGIFATVVVLILVFILIPIRWSPWWLTVASLTICAALAWLLFGRKE